MDELRNKPVKDVEALLDELEKEEVPSMTAELESQAMERIVWRKKELEEEGKPMRPGHALSHRWKAWLAVAAAFIFLFGGTLLTRKSFHNETSWNPGNGQPDVVFRPAAFNPPDGNPKTETTDPQEQNEAALFFEDMWMFLKISLPWAGGAGVVVLLVFLIRKRKKEHRS